MQDKLKVVVVHPDKQHSFMTAKAVKDMGCLDKYITSVYDKKNSLTNILIRFLRGRFKQKLSAHKTPLLDDCDVLLYGEFISLLIFICLRIDKKDLICTRLRKIKNRIFNKKVARYVERNKIDMIISFDICSGELFEEINKRSIPVVKVIDMSAPYVQYMHRIFVDEVNKIGKESRLYRLINSSSQRYNIKLSETEIKYADAFLVASDFTKKSLTEFGVDDDKIHKCIYGINHTFFNSSERKERKKTGLNCVYVGNVTEQKGCRYLFEAIKKIKEQEDVDINFTVIGAYSSNNSQVAEVKNLCKFTGHVLPEELKRLLLEMDVMIFPSLSDGFGFSVVEAMACGVVPVCSNNAGVSTVIEDGVSGFCIDAKSSEQICEKIQYLYNNRGVLRQMSHNASESIKGLTWENYYNDVKTALENIAEQR